MTDTTDIKVLRAGLTEQLDHMECYGGKGWVSQEDIRSILNALDQLEAELQRADDNSAECQRQASKVGRIKHELNKAEAELAALKGELANPVVLPERWKPCDCIDCAYAYDSEATKKAINEAGFTVKGDL